MRLPVSLTRLNRRFPLLLFLVLLLSSCSEFNGTRLEPLLGGDVNLVRLGDNIARTLVENSFPPLHSRRIEQPVLVTTPVENKNLVTTSDFGRNLQNAIIAGFVARGYSAKEIKLRSELVVQDQRGEFMLSRHLSDISNKQQAQAVVVGTYSLANRVMYLSVRMVSPADRTIRSVYEDRLYLDENSLRLLDLQFATTADKDDLVLPPRESILDKLLY